jgi:hypothetical protein
MGKLIGSMYDLRSQDMYLGLDPKKIKMKRNELKANFNTREKQEVGAMIFRYFMKLVIDDVLQGAYFHFTGLY